MFIIKRLVIALSKKIEKVFIFYHNTQPQRTVMPIKFNVILHSIPNVITGTVIKRPSAVCKSPYVADIQQIQMSSSSSSSSIQSIVAHAPALGCCGLSDANHSVVCSQIPTTKTTQQKTCSHRIELAIHTNVLGNTVFVGINPKLAETIVEKALCHNHIQCLKNIQSYSRETTFLNSRFDFSGVDADGRQFVLEVKNVPLADVVDVTKKERKAIEKENRSAALNNTNNTMIAYFPDGYRKTLKEDEVVSERALKHIKELQELKQTSYNNNNNNNIRTILCFVIQREDVTQFQPSKIDAIYRTAVYEAWRAGVEVITLQTKWRINNKGAAICEYLSSCELPITMTDEYGPLPLLSE